MNKSILIICIAVALLGAVPVGAQQADFSLKSADADSFPQVRVSISSASVPDRADLSVQENEAIVASFEIENEASPSAGAGPANVCFLVEASAYTRDKMPEIIRGLAASMKKDASRKYNVCWYGGQTRRPDGAAFQWLSAEFTSDVDALESKMRDVEAKARGDELQLYKAAYETIDWMDERSLEGNVALVIVGSARDAGKSAITSENCATKARDAGVSAYALTLYKNGLSTEADRLRVLADAAGGGAKNLAGPGELTGALGDLLPDNPGASGYALLYDSPLAAQGVAQPGQTVDVFVEYKGKTHQTAYVVPESYGPESGGLFNDPESRTLVIGGGVALLAALLGLALFMRSRNQKKRQKRARQDELARQEAARKAENDRRAQARAAPPPTAAGAGFDPRRTQVERAAGPARQVMVRAPGAQPATYQFDKPQITLGRAPENDIVVNDPAVSRQHLRFERQGGAVRAVDLGSANGVYYNGARSAQFDVRAGDQATVGETRLEFS